METAAWNRFCKEAFDLDGETNFKFDFQKLTKKYGKSYIEYLRLAYETNFLSIEEFCRLNHCTSAFIKRFCEKN